MVKNLIVKLVELPVIRIFLDKTYFFIKQISRLYRVVYMSHSTNFEDVILEKLCPDGHFYVDIGANHPVRYSNTYDLYKSGWHGINIDPLPGSMDLFKAYRPNDINLELGISNNVTSLEYFRFEEPTYNTMSKTQAEHVIKEGNTQFIGKKQINVDTMKNVFDTYLKGNKIDVLSLDVETMELKVLQSNDWERYRPKVIVMESFVGYIDDMQRIYDDEAVKFLIKQQYKIVAKVLAAVFFLDKKAEHHVE